MAGSERPVARALKLCAIVLLAILTMPFVLVMTLGHLDRGRRS